MDTSNSVVPQQPNGNGKITWPEAPSIKQSFSLPDSIIYYMAKNPTTLEVYLKLVQSCKYFFEKNSIDTVVARIHNGNMISTTYDLVTCKWKDIDFNKLSRKIWLTGAIEITRKAIPNAASLILSKIYRSENAQLIIGRCEMALKEFKLWASTFQNIFLWNVKIVDYDGRIVMLETILASIPNVKKFEYHFDLTTPAATASTIKNILKLQNLGHLRKLKLSNIPEIFNTGHLSKFLEVFENVKIWLDFDLGISEEYANQLDQLIDTVITSVTSEHVICYGGQNDEEFNVMKDRYRR